MNNNFARQLGLIAATTAATIALSACGGGGDDNTPASSPVTKGTIAVSLMTDAPACGFDAVNVTVSKLCLRQDANTDPNATGWTELNFRRPGRSISSIRPAS